MPRASSTFTHAEIAERYRQFLILEERGFVERHTLEDGSAVLSFPRGEDHPEIVAFNAARSIH
jgi:hypothetical protein